MDHTLSELFHLPKYIKEYKNINKEYEFKSKMVLSKIEKLNKELDKMNDKENKLTSEDERIKYMLDGKIYEFNNSVVEEKIDVDLNTKWEQEKNLSRTREK